MNKHEDFLLNNISGPQDLKKLSIAEMELLKQPSPITTYLMRQKTRSSGMFPTKLIPIKC